MGFFNLFKSTKITPRTDLIWMNQQAKAQGFIDFLSKNKVDICIAWFEETYEVYKNIVMNGIHKDIEFAMANRLSSYSLNNKNVVFLEHHPLFSKEKQLLEMVSSSKIWFINSLDDAMLRLFSGKVVELMKNMGMKENECIEHSMVSKSIVRAQQKLEENVISDYSAKSGEDWLKQYLLNKK